MYVTPKEGMKIPDPALKDFLPPEGREVGDDNRDYWQRRERDGDATIAQPQPAANPTASSSEAVGQQKKRAKE